MAWGLGVLQGCSGADAVAPTVPAAGNNPASVPVATLAPRIATVGPDTLLAGGVLVVEGEHFPANAHVRVTVAGVELPVKARSATRVEAALPLGAFPCTGAAVQPVQVLVGSAVYSGARMLQPAVRVSLEPGQSVSLLEAGQSRCVELAPAASEAGSGASARYVVAVVNTSTTPGNVASFELRGMGGAASGGTGAVGGEAITGGGSMAGLAAAPAPAPLPALSPRLLAARRELENQPAADAAHSALLSQQVQRVRAGGSALTAWQRAKQRVPAALSRVVAGTAAAASASAVRPAKEGDTLTFTAAHASCSAGRAVRARVVYAGSRALVLEDVAAPRAGTMDWQYRQLGGEFDSVVYPLLVKNIGDPLAMNTQLGGDGRVTMLFTRFVNDSLPGTAAYVNACNFYPRSTFAASNEDEVFYARVAGAWETPEEWRRAIRATVVHEAKHLASFAERLSRGVEFEEPWLEESTARIAEELYARTFPGGGSWKGNVGFASSVGCELLQCDDRPLIMWKHFSGLNGYLRDVDVMSPMSVGAGAGTQASYASGWALVRWVIDRFAEDERGWLRTLLSGEAGTGLAALSRMARKGERELISEWALALALDQVVVGPTTPNAAPHLRGSEQSWRVPDMMSGLARLFPGVFEDRPLKLHRQAFGQFRLTAPELVGSGVRFVSLEGTLSGMQQLELVVVGSDVPLRMLVARVQ